MKNLVIWINRLNFATQREIIGDTLKYCDIYTYRKSLGYTYKVDKNSLGTKKRNRFHLQLRLFNRRPTKPIYDKFFFYSEESHLNQDSYVAIS